MSEFKAPCIILDSLPRSTTMDVRVHPDWSLPIPDAIVEILNEFVRVVVPYETSPATKQHEEDEDIYYEGKVYTVTKRILVGDKIELYTNIFPCSKIPKNAIVHVSMK